MISCRLGVWCLGVTVALARMQSLDATVLLPADFAVMASESQVIVHARIIDARGELVGSRRTIESLVTVEVLSALKGRAGPSLVFRVPGGRVGRYRRIVVGAPSFSSGDEVVLFLRSYGPAIPMPYGLSQGVYRVSRSTGAPLVVPIAATEGVAGTVRGDPARRPLPLAEFVRQVRMLVERQP